MIFDDLRERAPRFVAIADHLERTFGLFMTRPLEELRASGADWAFCEKLCEDAWALAGGDEAKVLERADTLVDFSMEFLQLQKELEATGHYRYRTWREVDAHVYSDPALAQYGPPYVWAMYFTQAFWVSHGRVWRFFLEAFADAAALPPAGRVLEVPSGNGLFLTHFLSRNPAWRGVGIDLSDASVAFTERVLALNGVRARADVVKTDFFRYDDSTRFDRIVCGEFLEHVEDPLAVLRRLRALLAPEGRLFLTAAVYAANIDHIYLYERAQDVRDQLAAAGLRVERELVQAVLRGNDPEAPRTPVNYSAILAPA
jgi:2-polyprenyl-3-methyl-5-hydroxy-6-metoxy-1,4-benzoquinol methylase